MSQVDVFINRTIIQKEKNMLNSAKYSDLISLLKEFSTMLGDQHETPRRVQQLRSVVRKLITTPMPPLTDTDKKTIENALENFDECETRNLWTSKSRFDFWHRAESQARSLGIII